MKKLSFHTVFRTLIILMTVLVPSLVFAGEIIVVANKNVPVNTLTMDEVKAIFLGEKTKWSNDTKVTFVILKTAEDEKAFLKEYVGKSPSQFKMYWKNQIFTGKGSIPASFDNVNDLIDFVSKTDGAIAYISNDIAVNNVKKMNVE